MLGGMVPPEKKAIAMITAAVVAGEGESMSAEDKDKATLLLRDVPGEVVRELDARAETNYRSRSGEVLAILTAVCRGHVALPVSMDGATLAAVKAATGVKVVGAVKDDEVAV